MRILLAVIILAAVGWSIYWYVGARAVETGLTKWFAARAQEGWVVDHGAIAVAGFPNRFDTTIPDIELADPQTGVAWSAPFFQILALSYKPNHVIAVWPEQQRVATPRQKITATSGDMRGSVVFVPSTAFRLDRTTIEFETVGLSSTAGWQASLGEGQLAMRHTPTAERSYDIAFRAQEVDLPVRVAEILSERGLVSETVAQARVKATVVFDRVWDRRAIEDRRPQPRRIEIDVAEASWGELSLRVAGTLDVDAQGRPEGSVTVQATNWRELVRLAEAARLWPEQAAPLIERGLETVAGMSGNPNSIDVPLRFKGGRMSLGGVVPLGQAPRFVLR